MRCNRKNPIQPGLLQRLSLVEELYIVKKIEMMKSDKQKDAMLTY